MGRSEVKFNSRLVLGLDIGITSVGWAIIDIVNNMIVDYGVRLFKEGTAENNLTRRTKRGARRLKRRKHTRIEDMGKALEHYGIKSENYVPLGNPYELRVKGLHEKLSNDELTCVLLHLAKNRGSSLETVSEDEKDGDEMKAKAILQSNKKLLSQGYFICEVQMQRLTEQGKIRGITNNFRTEDYVNEAREILNHQDLNEEVKEAILRIIARKRAYYEGPGSEKSPTPYGRWTEFGAEPIDLIEKMRGKCSVYPDEPRAPKASYTAELFNLLNDLNNLTIQDEKITTEQKLAVIEYVDVHGGITVNQLVKLLKVPEADITGFRINKSEKKILTEFTGYKAIKKIFDQHDETAYQEDKEIVDDISEILTRCKGVQERFDAIQDQFPFLSTGLIAELSEMKGMSAYHSLSFKAMREMIEEMKVSEYNLMQLLYQMELYGKNRISTKGQKNIYADDTAILSPVAKRAQRETFKVVNALRKQYGEFDSIVIETTRSKNSQEQKSEINKRQKVFENENKKVNELLSKNGYLPNTVNGKTKLKIRLYLLQDGKSAYTLKPIDLNELINDSSAYEIDHIIPLSVSLDDSLANKVLATHKENQVKGNLTPIDAYLKGKFNGMGCSMETFIASVKSNKNYGLNKKRNLLYAKDITKFTNIQDFIARNLVDTSYACRVVLNTLQNYFKDNEIPTKVHTIKGKATNTFRGKINLKKERDEDYLHHAIDAMIVASIKKLNLFNTYLSKYNLNELYNEETGEFLKVEDDQAVLDPIHLEFIMQLKTIYEQSNQYYNGLIKRKDMTFKPIKISHKVDTKPNRQVADETIYSTRVVDGVEKVVKKYKDIYEPKFVALAQDIVNGNKDKYLMYHNDPQTFSIIENIVMDHFNTYKDDEKIYSSTSKKGVTLYSIKGENNPLYLHKEQHGKVHKYSKKNNGPEITVMKYYDGKLGNKIDISHKYDVKDKKVVLQQISPYRTDFYIGKDGKYKMVTVRYKDVFYSATLDMYQIDEDWYNEQKRLKGIDDTYEFVCSLHRDELIGITKKEGQKFVYDLSKEKDGAPRFYHGDVEVLKFTATNNDTTNVIEVKPMYTYSVARCMISLGSIVKIEKYATDVLGNMYKVTQNVLKLKFK